MVLNTETLLTEIRSLVQAACKEEANIFGYSIFTHHILHVVHYRKELARLKYEAYMSLLNQEQSTTVK